MISNKIKIIFSILFMSCSFVTDSEDSDSTANPLVGTWNLTTITIFENQDCSGDPVYILDINSEDDLADVLGLDLLQVKATITIDLYIILHEATSTPSSTLMEESAVTGILMGHGDQFCVIWDKEDYGDCDDCVDYTINGDELELQRYNCKHPVSTEPNILCQKSTFVKQALEFGKSTESNNDIQ
jgi:hypothetical protein